MTLSLKAITKKFGGRTILHNLDLTVCDGECVALLGPSGCGKSTALRLIAGLDQPESGSISIDGSEMNNVPAEDRRIGMVFQSYALFPHLSVRENLELGLRMRGSHGAEREQRITTILEVLQLNHQAHQRPSQLSGGQRQRVAIARALVTNPSILLADEPTGNLDSTTGEEIMRLFDNIHAAGNTLIVVTHEQHIADHAGRVVRLSDGDIVSDTARKE